MDFAFLALEGDWLDVERNERRNASSGDVRGSDVLRMHELHLDVRRANKALKTVILSQNRTEIFNLNQSVTLRSGSEQICERFLGNSVRSCGDVNDCAIERSETGPFFEASSHSPDHSAEPFPITALRSRSPSK
jgi:hypothetical protein